MVIFQARQSNIVQAGFLTTQFPKKQWIYEAFGVRDEGLHSNIVYQVLARPPQPILAKPALLLTDPICEIIKPLHTNYMDKHINIVIYVQSIQRMELTLKKICNITKI